jgi:hypothetical protein
MPAAFDLVAARVGVIHVFFDNTLVLFMLFGSTTKYVRAIQASTS